MLSNIVKSQNNNDPSGIYKANQNGNVTLVQVQKNPNNDNQSIKVMHNGRQVNKPIKDKSNNCVVLEDDSVICATLDNKIDVVSNGQTTTYVFDAALPE